MAKKTKAKRPRAKGEAMLYGTRTTRGEKMLKGHWKLLSPHLLEFPATLIDTIKHRENQAGNFQRSKNISPLTAVRCAGVPEEVR
jgi:hypothetical protein